MARPEVTPRYSQVLLLATVALCLTGLYFARVVLIPIALSILLSFLLAPLVSRLERWRFPRIPAVIAVMLVVFGLLGILGYVVAGQILDLTNKLPSYQGNIAGKIERVKSHLGGFGRGSDILDRIKHDLSRPMSQPVAATQAATRPVTQVTTPQSTPALPQAIGNLAGGPTPTPIQVQIVSEPNPFKFLEETLSPWIDPLTTAGIVTIIVIFMLIQREDLRDRMIRLVSRGHLNLTTQAMDEAATRISRYLLMQLLVNVTYGIPIAIGLYFIGIPNAILWGLLATLLRFIPYIGPWIAASIPIVLSIAVFPGYRQAVETIALYLVVELISNNAVEPWLYGTSTGMSSVAILISAMFWTWLWGPVGLLMSTPLTVCLVVLGKYVPQFQFLDIMLGDEPVLEPPMRIYQRLLAQDSEEAQDLVEEYLQEKTLLEVYDQVLVPAMGLAEYDRHRGHLTEERHKFICDSMKEIIEDVGERYRLPTIEESQATVPGTVPNTKSPIKRPCVLCLPARDEADEIVAMMLAQVLDQSSCETKFVPVAALASEMVEAVSKEGTPIVCISAVPPSAVAHARYLCKRLRARMDSITLVVGLWGAKGDLKKAMARLRCDDSDKIVTTLAEAIAQVQPLVTSMRTMDSVPKLEEVEAGSRQ
jgi:predicted PurR-regulated permease PerM